MEINSIGEVLRLVMSTLTDCPPIATLCGWDRIEDLNEFGRTILTAALEVPHGDQA